MQALHRARCIGDAPKLPVFRLYLRGTVEERLLQRAAARGSARVPTRRLPKTQTCDSTPVHVKTYITTAINNAWAIVHPFPELLRCGPAQQGRFQVS